MNDRQMQSESSVEFKLQEVADRVRGLRMDMGLTPEEAAARLDLSVEEYVSFESGTQDFNFTFIYKFANMAGVEISDIMEGSSPALTEYAVTRNGQGSPIKTYRIQVSASGFQIQEQALRAFPRRSSLFRRGT